MSVEGELLRIKKLCKEEIKYGSFFNGNIQACDFAYWLEHSNYMVGGKMPVKRCSTIDALAFMKDWAIN